jgi:hypothetical protein
MVNMRASLRSFLANGPTCKQTELLCRLRLHLLTSCAAPERCVCLPHLQLRAECHLQPHSEGAAADRFGVAVASAACSSWATTSRGGQNVLPAAPHSRVYTMLTCVVGRHRPCQCAPKAYGSMLPCHASAGHKQQSLTCTPESTPSGCAASSALAASSSLCTRSIRLASRTAASAAVSCCWAGLQAAAGCAGAVMLSSR